MKFVWDNSKNASKSRPVRRTKKKGKDTSTLSTAMKKELLQLAKKSDQEIDYSDIPEVDFDNLDEPVIGKFYKSIKKPISIRLDADISDKKMSLV